MKPRKKAYERDEHHELGAKKAQDNLKSKVESWLGDGNDLGKELKMLIEKWLPKSRKKPQTSNHQTSAETQGEAQLESSHAKKKAHGNRPLLGMFEGIQKVFQPRAVPDEVWRRSYHDGKVLGLGFLEKQGGKIKSWHKRLFLLREHGLYYFGERRNYVKGEPPRGYFMFKDVIPTKDRKVCQQLHLFLMIGKPHTFSLHSPERTLVISARTHKEMKRWTEAIEEAYLAFWRRYEIVPPTTEASPSTQGQLMSLEETHTLAEVLDTLDLEFEQEEEYLKRRIYLAKTFMAWKYAMQNDLLNEEEEDEES